MALVKDCATLEALVPTDEFDALTKDFVAGHPVQWNTFVKKIGEDELTDAKFINE